MNVKAAEEEIENNRLRCFRYVLWMDGERMHMMTKGETERQAALQIGRAGKEVV